MRETLIQAAQRARLEFNKLTTDMSRKLVERFERGTLSNEDLARPDVQIALTIWPRCVVQVRGHPTQA